MTASIWVAALAVLAVASSDGPIVIQNSYWAKPGLEEAVYRALEVLVELHAVDVAWRLLKCRAPKYTFHQPIIQSDDEDGSEAFDREADSVAVHTGLRSHAGTCQKGASGKMGCRMASQRAILCLRRVCSRLRRLRRHQRMEKRARWRLRTWRGVARNAW